jgi:hypothetical protein
MAFLPGAFRVFLAPYALQPTQQRESVTSSKVSPKGFEILGNLLLESIVLSN